MVWRRSTIPTDLCVLWIAVEAALLGFGCSSTDDLGRHRGEDGGPFDGSAGRPRSEAGSGATANGTGGSAGGEPTRSTGGTRQRGAGGAATGGRRSPDAGSEGDSAAGGAGAADASTSGVDATTRIPIEQFQQELVHALCDNVQKCCSQAGRGFDAVHCRQAVIQQYVVPLSDTSVLYDSAQVARCIERVNQLAQACESVDATTCFGAFVGTLPPGAPCSSSFDCAPGPNGHAFCDKNALCSQPRRGALGDPCSYTCIERGGLQECRYSFSANTMNGADCHTADGLVCVAPPGGSPTCQPSATDCKQDPEGSCATGQVCNLSSGQCYVPVPLGKSCAATPCDNEDYCASSGVCVPLKPNAAICTNDSECQSHKCELGFCVVYSKAAADWCGATIGP